MSSNSTNYRRDVIDAIIPHAKNDERIVLLICDMGFGVADNFKKELPERIFNVGIMEQGVVGIAAGMAMSGLLPIVYSMVNFLAFRAIEQVRNDVVLQNLNVKLLATGANNHFTFLGKSHCCGEDDKKIMELINIKVFDPYENGTAFDFKQMVEDWVTSTEAGYLRV
jgi:transketolase